MDIQPYIVYARVDDEGRITGINSSEFLLDVTGWTRIDSGYSDRFHHAQGNYLPGPLMDRRGICRYRMADGRPEERTQEEMDTDLAARPAPEMTDVELLLATAADHEYRLCLMELGVTEE